MLQPKKKPKEPAKPANVFLIDNQEKKRLAQNIQKAEIAAWKYYHAQKCKQCRYKKMHKAKGRE